MIRAEYFVLWTLPPIASLNTIVLVERDRRSLLRLWLCMKIRVLRLDLPHLLRLRLLRRPHPFSSRVLLAGCRNWRSCTCRSCRCRSSTRRCLRVCASAPRAFSALFRLVLAAGRCTGGRLTGNVRSWGRRRFLGRPTLSAFSCTRLIRSAALFHRAGWLRDCLLRLGRVRPGLCFGRVRFFSALLRLWSRLFLWRLSQRGSSQHQRTAY